jgi:hypothetical protein
MAAKKNQTYDLIFVHESGKQLEKIGILFNRETPLETSIDSVYSLDKVNDALKKVSMGRSKGKTIIKIEEE